MNDEKERNEEIETVDDPDLFELYELNVVDGLVRSGMENLLENEYAPEVGKRYRVESYFRGEELSSTVVCVKKRDDETTDAACERCACRNLNCSEYVQCGNGELIFVDATEGLDEEPSENDAAENKTPSVSPTVPPSPQSDTVDFETPEPVEEQESQPVEQVAEPEPAPTETPEPEPDSNDVRRWKEQAERDRISILKRDKFADLLLEMAKRRREALEEEANAKETARNAKKLAERLEKEYNELLFRGPDSLQLDDSPLLTLAERADSDGSDDFAAFAETSDATDAAPNKVDWRTLPISELRGAVKPKTFDAVAEHFETLGDLGDWLSVGDRREKRKGLTAKRVDELAAVLEAFYADEEAAELEKAAALAKEREEKRADEENAATTPPEEPTLDDDSPLIGIELTVVRESLIPNIDRYVDEGSDWPDFDPTFFFDVKRQFEETGTLTRKQYDALRNIQEGFFRWEDRNQN